LKLLNLVKSDRRFLEWYNANFGRRFSVPLVTSGHSDTTSQPDDDK
jgi:hypothetical protein